MYSKLLELFQINKGDCIYISSDLIKLALMMKKEGTQFEPSVLLELFQDAVGMEGTLMLPTFCFDFCNEKKYDYRKSKGTSGVLGNIALERCGYNRTKHPMHSFAVWGKDADLLCSMNNMHSFGNDSPFAYCKEKNVKQIMLGTDYRRSMSFIHYVETVCNVPYRFLKKFSGVYVVKEGEEIRTYEYAARRLDIGATEQFNRIGAILEQSHIAWKVNFNDYICHQVRLGDSFEFIYNDIMKNQCRNIYDFNVSREKLFQGFGE